MIKCAYEMIKCAFEIVNDQIRLWFEYKYIGDMK